MDLLGTLATQIAGGAAASYADREFPQYAQKIPGTDVTVSVGALASLGVAVGLAILPGKTSSSMWKQVLANMAGGGLVYEGTKLAEQQLLPMLSSSQPTPVLPPAVATAGLFPPGYGAGYGMTDYELSRALGAYQTR